MEHLRGVVDEIKSLYEELNNAVSQGEVDKGIEIGLKLFSKLTEISRTYVLLNILDENVRETVDDIIRDYEQALCYLKGANDALKGFSNGEIVKTRKEILRILIAYVQGMIGFVLGALAILMDCGRVLAPVKNGIERQSGRKSNVLLHII
ncbi:MAG: hypothetical protein DRN04_03040 [Thermoprotei archaeon]|nr:MAG: hypothetical protein DRN04_03040 [Thermoprotei archaeon]